VAQTEVLHDQLSERSVRDPLTGLYNRRFFDECLERELARSARHHGPLSVAAVDIDDFKQINDAHGHAEGDRILVLLATLLKSTIRESDVACRPGGDEFVVLLPSLALEDAVRRAEGWRRSFRERLESTGPPGADPAGCTLSIGVAALRDGESCAALLQRLDQTLYEAKRAGRDRVTSRA
jgi:diguanylate cyclase (GGDEF)-like protein